LKVTDFAPPYSFLGSKEEGRQGREGREGQEENRGQRPEQRRTREGWRMGRREGRPLMNKVSVAKLF
jgi:hypothetical protein